MNNINNGIWPTMLTPFTKDNKIDYDTIEKLVEWYIEKGVDGIFAMCQSSEMFDLSTQEKIDVIKFTVKCVNKRVPVIASGHTSFDMKEQIKELNLLKNTGIDALVLISNILATKEKSEDAFKKSVLTIMKNVKGIPFGIYECPYPFKYVVSPELLKWCADTKRFIFLKDTCCDIEIIRKKLEAVKGTELKIYNANTATLAESLQAGCAGYSGVMANIHPELYSYLYKNYNDEKSGEINDFICIASLCENLDYPVCAKYYLNKYTGMEEYSRKKFTKPFTDTDRSLMENIRNLTDILVKKYVMK